MRPGLRKVLLFGGLAGVVGFLLVDRPAKTPELAAAKAVGAAPQQESPDSLQLPDRSGLTRSRGELFNAPPPPKKQEAPRPTVEAPPAPVAPPVPYRFAGKVLRGSEEEVLISKGELVFPVRVGDTLDGAYRVASINGERIELVYVPLGTTDRIQVTSTLAVDPAPSTPVPAVADGAPAQLRWEGPARVQAGTSFSVALRVSTKETLRSAPMQIRFEPDVLEPVIVRPGKFFGTGDFSYRVNPSGSIFVGATSQPASPGADAELVVVTFRPIKRGATAELSMSALSLQGVAGRAIAHEQVAAFRTAIH